MSFFIIFCQLSIQTAMKPASATLTKFYLPSISWLTSFQSSLSAPVASSSGFFTALLAQTFCRLSFHQTASLDLHSDPYVSLLSLTFLVTLLILYPQLFLLPTQILVIHYHPKLQFTKYSQLPCPSSSSFVAFSKGYPLLSGSLHSLARVP